MNRSPFDYHQHQPMAPSSAASTPGEGPYRRAALFEFELPEHLPTSPMCPAHPKNKSKGKGVCVVCILPNFLFRLLVIFIVTLLLLLID